MRLHRSCTRLARLARGRRGVTSILAMMFVVLFGSLAAAMAIASSGNLRTAHTHIVVSRALGAADTGLGIAGARMRQAARSIRVTKGEVTDQYAMALWSGTFSPGDGEVLLPDGSIPSGGIRGVVADLHAEDVWHESLEDLAAPADNPSSWLDTDPVIVAQEGEVVTQAVRISYVPVPARGLIRAVVTGYAYDGIADRWISRTVQQDFDIFKRVDQAILAPSKVMIGKNVVVNGPLAARFMGVESFGGHPLVMRSDFYGMDPQLDQKLRDLYSAVRGDGFDGGDANGDNRLADGHALESQGYGQLNDIDYDGDTQADQAFQEETGDGYVDEFDVFLRHFDDDGDRALVWSEDLAASAGNPDASAEFSGIDDDLALLIDSGNADRNNDGVVDAKDRTLGYLDGVIDYKDRYAKVRGSVYFETSQNNWNENGRTVDGEVVGDYREHVEGSIRPDRGDPTVAFDVDEAEIGSIDASTFDSAQTELASRADGGPFTSQAGVSWVFQPATNGDGVVVGQDYNPSIPTVVESVPFGAPAPVDYYERPVFQGLTFRNVKIPRGTNALFIDCTFVGVTKVESYPNNSHPAWQFYGVQNADLSLKYPPPSGSFVPEVVLDNDYIVPGENLPPSSDFDEPRLIANGAPHVNTKPLSNNVRFHDCEFIGSIVADKPNNFTHIRNKIQFTGATRFFEEHPEEPTNPDLNPDAGDLDEIRKSSMLLPSYSVDIGTNNAPAQQDVNLKGLIIAGVLDVRGNAVIDGALMTDFSPSTDDPALQHFGQSVGNPAHFNMTLGYFGPDDGDEEGLEIFEHEGQRIVGFDTDGDGWPDTTEFEEGAVPVPFNGFGRIMVNWNPNLVMPDGLLAPISAEPVADSYTEGKAVRIEEEE